MAMSDGLTAADRQPVAKPPVTSSQSPGTPMDSARGPRTSERIESLQKTIESILIGAEWPSESKQAVKGLLNTVQSSPNTTKRTTSISQELQDLLEQYIRTLEDVHSRLKDASSKSGMQRWKILQRIKSLASNRASKCTLLFQTCQDDVSKVVMSVNECLENDRKRGEKDQGPALSPENSCPVYLAEDLVASGVLPGSHAQLFPATAGKTGAAPFNVQTTSTDLSSDASPIQHLLSSAHDDTEYRTQIRAEGLIIARKTFKVAEIASGSIPVVGNFVAAAAKVGLAFVESIQTMDRNDDLAKDLGLQTDKLSILLEDIAKKRNEDQGEGIENHVVNLQKELREIHGKVKGWESLGRFNKAFNSRDHAEALKSYQGTIQTALEEMQLLAGIDTRKIVIELKSSEMQEKNRRLLDRLGDGKYGARGNAVEDVICFPGTRVGILERIDTWTRDPSNHDRVLWICGMAGRGKSTIASTVVHNWNCRASCAIFHFRRGQSALNTRVICALARQLGTSLVPEVRNAVLESIRENEDIADKRLEEQFKTLLVSPLTKPGNQNHPILIVIDALDECDDPKDAADLVRLIDRHSSSFPANIKFLLTSRPEVHLLRALEPKQWLIEDLDSAVDVSGDLERFIQQACGQIRESDPDVPETWPSPDDVSRLVEMSQGLFQWARTAITYMHSGSPVSRLRSLLKSPSKWSGLDDLYHQILSKAFNSFRLDLEREDLLHRVLGTLVVAPFSISLDVIADLYRANNIFEEMDQGEVILFLRKDILADLNSLLFIPTSPNEPIRLMHTSIHDLLVSEHRCKQQPYYVNIIQHHQQLASLCLSTMLGHLKENICNLSDLSKPSSDVQDIAERDVSKAVLYSSRSWSTHLTEGIKWPSSVTNASAIESDFKLFGTEKIMCWLEVMSLAGATPDAIRMARRVHQWCSQCPVEGSEFSSLATLWNDVQRFITMFSEPISFGPLHIYASALPHCPVETEIWNIYGKYAKVQTLRGHRTLTWPSNLWARSTGSGVRAVAVSSDGKLLASGSNDKTIRLWDPQTGTAVGEPLTGHGDSVQSVCFSPDGKLLVSGSDDNTIRLWDPQTGAAVGEPLTGHSSWISSVCFSPDGNLLASGSGDKTVQLWDPQTGAAVGEPLTGHSTWISSVCFSPDGNLLASGSGDKTVRLWDPQTGAAVGEPLTGHDDSVQSVCFSPDGKLLTSAAGETIRLWDPRTGTAVGEPLTGHSDRVFSICFSPDGKILASGSCDQTIRLWDPRSGTAVGEPLTGHSTAVWCLCFLPRGNLLVSGSIDHTIQLWDPQTGTAVGEPLTGHGDSVQSVCFSPDGKLLASVSDDKTIQLWDPQTGTAVGEPLTGHSHLVWSICFSPDGKLLASGSDDFTIRLWDPQTGTAVGKPLTGRSKEVYSVCFSPDGKLLASAAGRTIRLWDPQTRTAVGELLRDCSGSVYSVCFSPDGKLLASGSHRVIHLWDHQAGTTVGKPLHGHGFVTSVRFSSNGKYVMANYSDGGFAAWDANTSQSLDTLPKLLTGSNLGYQDHWIKAFPSRLFWLPPPYWGNYPIERQIIVSGKILVVLCKKRLSIFDVSQILES